MVTKACLIKNGIKNTGKECDIAMGAVAMLVAISPSVKWTDTDLADEYGWLNTLIHQRKAFPLFGQKAPIKTITNNAEPDVLETLDDGSRVFVRYGMFNREFATTAGGLCYAQSLQGLLQSGYSMIEIDQTGRMLFRQNQDGTYSGLLTDFMYSPSPLLADFKTSYKNRFQYVLNPVEMVQNGHIFAGGSSLLSLMGLIDVEINPASVASSTTKLKINVQTECAGADLIAMFPTQLPVASNFIVKNKATGATVSITAAAIVSGVIELTGTFVSAQSYLVYGAAPTVWKTALIEGYDGSQDYAEILIP